jgi:hypothetical protein
MVGHEAEHLTIHLMDHSVTGIAKASGARRDFREHGLKVSR